VGGGGVFGFSRKSRRGPGSAMCKLARSPPEARQSIWLPPDLWRRTSAPIWEKRSSSSGWQDAPLDGIFFLGTQASRSRQLDNDDHELAPSLRQPGHFPFRTLSQRKSSIHVTPFVLFSLLLSTVISPPFFGRRCFRMRRAVFPRFLPPMTPTFCCLRWTAFSSLLPQTVPSFTPSFRRCFATNEAGFFFEGHRPLGRSPSSSPPFSPLSTSLKRLSACSLGPSFAKSHSSFRRLRGKLCLPKDQRTFAPGGDREPVFPPKLRPFQVDDSRSRFFPPFFRDRPQIPKPR